MLINVTQEDIDRGIQMNCSLCPIALAIKRTFGPNTYVQVGPATVTICLKKYDYRGHYIMNHKGRALVRRFDWGDKVEPTMIQLEPLCESA